VHDAVEVSLCYSIFEQHTARITPRVDCNVHQTLGDDDNIGDVSTYAYHLQQM
jgi:hypothetical protein